MSEPAANDANENRPWFQFSIRSVGLLILGIAVVLAAGIWVRETQIEPYERKKEIVGILHKLLRAKPPPDLTKESWHIAAIWTFLLAKNAHLEMAEISELRRFHSALMERAKGTIDMKAIVWIWDEIERMGCSPKLCQRHRADMLNEVARGKSDRGLCGQDLEP